MLTVLLTYERDLQGNLLKDYPTKTLYTKFCTVCCTVVNVVRTIVIPKSTEVTNHIKLSGCNKLHKAFQ